MKWMHISMSLINLFSTISLFTIEIIDDRDSFSSDYEEAP